MIWNVVYKRIIAIHHWCIVPVPSWPVLRPILSVTPCLLWGRVFKQKPCTEPWLLPGLYKRSELSMPKVGRLSFGGKKVMIVEYNGSESWRISNTLFALNRGMAASLFGLTHVAVQFPLYEWLKKRARHQQPDKQETAMDLLVASGLSKMCASLLTYPHEVVRSRMMDARTTKSLRNTISRIYVKEGIHGFYTGLHISLLRVLPNCCITFLSYELLLRWSRQHIQHENPNDST